MDYKHVQDEFTIVKHKFSTIDNHLLVYAMFHRTYRFERVVK